MRCVPSKVCFGDNQIPFTLFVEAYRFGGVNLVWVLSGLWKAECYLSRRARQSSSGAAEKAGLPRARYSSLG